MLSCLLCLEIKPKLIKINSKKGKAMNCSSVIAQHFWLKRIRPNNYPRTPIFIACGEVKEKLKPQKILYVFQPNTTIDSRESVCLTCWDVVIAFHRLYELIAKAHNFLEAQVIANDSDVLLTPNEEQQTHKVDDVLFIPEVKMEITDLELLPQAAVIENTNDDNEDTQKTLELTHQNTEQPGDANINPISDLDTNQELSTISENDSELDYPLSKLLGSAVKSELEDTMRNSGKALNTKKAIKRKNRLISSKCIKSIKVKKKSESMSSLAAKCASDHENESGTSNSVGDLGSDYDPSEDDAAVRKIKRTKKKRMAEKKLELDGNISKFYQKLSCSKCQFSVEDFDALIRHAETTHKNKPTVLCCKRLFKTRKSLSSHVLTHLYPHNFICSMCDKTFNNSLLLEKHIETKHRCSQCSKVFQNLHNLKEHKIVKHLPKTEYKFECTECHEKYPIKRNLWEHLSLAHGKGSPIICEKCGKRVRNRYVLNRHMLSHSEQPQLETNRVQCDECGKWLKHEDSLRGHKYIVHEARYQQQCSLCNKVMPSVRALERHIIHSHQKERKFKCPMCEKAFKDNRDLQQHINLHTKALVYTCDICEKNFNQTASLHKHKKVFHPNNQLERPDPVQCKICNAWLKTLPGLKSHIKVRHEGSEGDHRCHICKHVSVNAMALKRHIKRNHGKISNKVTVATEI